MHKLVFLGLTVILLQSCAETGHFDVDFARDQNSIKMKPTRYLTTFNLIEIEGEIDCNVNILIPGENMIILEAGEINYSKRHEWFDSGKTIQILHNGCSSKSHLRIYYNYTASYW
ncbi:MAG: hypothetical protein H6567_03435 [Lewinellaceae bacterium]|nr:hypothetical protein [Lewinellaceae bacterium]